MKYLIIVISIVLFFGCSTIKTPITEYRIVADNKAFKTKANGCNDKSIKVAQAFSSSSLMSMKMNYILSNNKTFSYSQAQWSETPNRAISLEVLKQIRESEIFKNAQSSRSRTNSDLLLEISIEDFIQYYDDDLSESYVIVAINFSLIDMRTNEVRAAKTFRSKIIADTTDALGGAEALNKALSDVLSKNRVWLAGECK